MNAGRVLFQWAALRCSMRLTPTDLRRGLSLKPLPSRPNVVRGSLSNWTGLVVRAQNTISPSPSLLGAQLYSLLPDDQPTGPAGPPGAASSAVQPAPMAAPHHQQPAPLAPAGVAAPQAPAHQAPAAAGPSPWPLHGNGFSRPEAAPALQLATAPAARAPMKVDFQVAPDDVEAMFADDGGGDGDYDEEEDDGAEFEIMLDDDELIETPEDGFEIIVDDEARAASPPAAAPRAPCRSGVVAALTHVSFA